MSYDKDGELYGPKNNYGWVTPQSKEDKDKLQAEIGKAMKDAAEHFKNMNKEVAEQTNKDAAKWKKYEKVTSVPMTNYTGGEVVWTFPTIKPVKWPMALDLYQQDYQQPTVTPDPIQIPVFVPPVMRCEYTILGLGGWYPWQHGDKAIRTIDDLFSFLEANPYEEFNHEISLRRMPTPEGKYFWFDPARPQQLYRFVPDTNYEHPTTLTSPPQSQPNQGEEVKIPPATWFEREFV